MPKSDRPEADSALTELGYVAYHGSLTLEELMMPDRRFLPAPASAGPACPNREDRGIPLGYVAYHGSLTLEELMMENPAEQYQQEQEMGGMA